jgi:hypothetical protein
MTDLRYTLVTDGSIDKAFIPLLTWLLQDVGVQYPVQAAWADLVRVPDRPRTLEARIRWVLA